MSRRAIRRRVDFAEEPVDRRLQLMLRDLDDVFRVHVMPEIRRRRWHVGPAEARRLKARLNLKRQRKQAAKSNRQRAAARRRDGFTIRTAA